MAMRGAPPSRAGYSGERPERCSGRAAFDYDAITVAARPCGISRRSPWASTSSASLHNTLRRFNSANVIGSGRAPDARKIMCYTARTGTIWAAIRRRRAGPIFNGAVDNATGVAGTADCWRNPSSAPSPSLTAPSCFWRIHRRGSRLARLGLLRRESGVAAARNGGACSISTPCILADRRATS
jgi:hypothetical protein